MIFKRLMSRLVVGSKVTVRKTITHEDLDKFATLTGDDNPIHRTTNRAIVHGAYLNGLVAGVIGTHLPGPGTLVISQNLYFPNKCHANDEVNICVELIEMRKIMTINFWCMVGKRIVLEGDARVIVRPVGG